MMAEPKAEIDLSAPFESVKAAVSMFGEKIPAKTQGLPHPHVPHVAHAPSVQYVGTYHGPNYQAEVLSFNLLQSHQSKTARGFNETVVHDFVFLF